MSCETLGFTSGFPWFHLMKPLVLQGETMGFATHFPDFSSLKRIFFTHNNSNKYSLTSLS